MQLAVDRSGAGPRLVLVHGFTQTRRCWGDLAPELARDHEVLAVDAPGHGRSSGVRATFEAAAALIGEAGGRASYLGYSMGGRLCLELALDRPDLVDRLVLVGASPGIDDPGERERRRVGDRALADHLEAVGVAAFLQEWLAQPLFAGLSAGAAALPERLTNSVPGLSSSLRLAGTGVQPSLWPRLPELDQPVLIMSGALDEKFTAIGERMAAAIGANATHLVVPAAGHTAHLEQPDAFLTALRVWLRRHPPLGAP